MKKNTFVEGTVIASLSIIITKLLGALYVIPFYSIIGEKGGALYSYAYNIYNLFLNISVAGLPLAMSKIISEYNALEMYEAKERSYKIGRSFILIVSLLCFFLLFVFSNEFAYLILGDVTGGNTLEDVSLVIKCVSFCLLIVPFLSVSKGYLQGHKFISPTSISQVIEQIVRISIILVGSYIVVKVLNQKVSIGVGVAMLGAFAGGLVAYIYLKIKIRKNKKLFNMPQKNKRDNVENIEIIKKIATYALPLIIVSVATDIYGMTDLTLVIRGLSKLGYSGESAETISSIISTWAPKICMLVNAIATGISVSLIPNMVSSKVKGNMEDVNKKFSSAINIIIVIALPLTIGISILAGPVYTLFYGKSMYGTVILRYLVFTSFFASLHIVMNMALQSLNKYKIVYLNTLLGFLTNALLDLPLMYLFNKIGIYPFYGAITATIIGYIISFIIILVSLKKEMKFNYSNIYSTIKKVILPLILMIIPLIVLNIVVNFKTDNRLIQIPIIILYGVIGMCIYLPMTYKNEALTNALGNEYIDKFLKRLRLKK